MTRHEVLAVEDRFFDALLRGDGDALEAVLSPDFLLIDVMTGSEVSGPALIGLVGSGQLRFESVERLDAPVCVPMARRRSSPARPACEGASARSRSSRIAGTLTSTCGRAPRGSSPPRKARP